MRLPPLAFFSPDSSPLIIFTMTTAPTDSTTPPSPTDSSAAPSPVDATTPPVSADATVDPVSLEKLRRFYRWNAAIYDYTRWAILRNRGRAFRQLAVPVNARYLDVGCGTGLNFPYIVKQQSQLARLWALDLSDEMLKVAQKKIERMPVLRDIGRTIQANAEDYTIDEFATLGPPQVISYAYSLSMIPDWEASLRCSWNHLEPGGTMMILDFGDMHGLWPIGKAFVAYLRANHVKHFGAPWVEVLRQLTPEIEHRGVFGYYSVITVAKKPATNATT